MAENMMNTAHKSSSKRSRDGWLHTFGRDSRDPADDTCLAPTQCLECGCFDILNGICLSCGEIYLSPGDRFREEAFNG